MRLAPTGSASFNIPGSTIHTALKIPVNAKFTAPTDAQRTGLHNTFRSIRYIVIKEISMVSLQLMTQDDRRLPSAAFERPRSAKPFGGMDTLSRGDFYMLPVTSPVTAAWPLAVRAWQLMGRSLSHIHAGKSYPLLVFASPGVSGLLFSGGASLLPTCSSSLS